MANTHQDMPHMIIDFVVNKLKDPVYEEIMFQLGINDVIKELKDRLEYMQGFLKDTSEGNQDTGLAEVRVKQVRETAYHIEDVIDEFMVEMELLEASKPSNFCEFNNIKAVMLYFIKRAWLRCQFHQQLKSIKNRLMVQEEEKAKYQIKTVEHEDESLLVGSHHRTENVDVVGMNEEFAELRDLVEKPRDHMLVITVWGPGGSGKTTLVKNIYGRVQMNKEINCWAWVYVKQSHRVEELLASIVKAFSTNMGNKVPDNLHEMDENDLRQSISKILKQKRYVLILDDVWDSEILKQFGLPVEKMSSIIVTSRQKTVALGSFLGVQQKVVEVKPLNPNSSWDLFCKVAFLNNIPPDNLIETLGRELVRRCNGLPLAILAIGQLMSTKGNDPQKWNDVLRDFGSELQGDLAELNRALLLSYYHLPTHLKHCFLYCAMFPTFDPIISIRKLIRLWIAEGFVKAEGQKTLEKIARGYFDQLINRSMLQFRYESKGFQMHDLLHDVAVPMIAKENFGRLLYLDDTALDSNQRRLVLYCSTSNVQLDTCKLKVRSLIAIYAHQFCSSFSQMLQNIKLIRTLHLERVLGIENVPDGVGDLIHLRYLSLRETFIKDLPDSMKKLRHLQTLDIRGNSMKSVPEGIAELKQLRHLLMEDFILTEEYPELPDITFKFTQLQSLDGVLLNLNQARQLKSTTQITKLSISATGEESWGEICDAIEGMINLRSLKLRPRHCSSEILKLVNLSVTPYLEKLLLVSVNQLPNFIASHNCLREISLHVGSLFEDSFITLGQLPRLKVLKMEDNYQGKQLVCEGDSFPELEEFDISYADKLTTWNQISKGSMKCLCKLTIKFCDSLQMLDLFYMPEKFVQRIDIGEPDYLKIQHIPRIRL